MRCTKAHDRILERSWRVLPPVIEAELARHLETCPACAAWAEEEDALTQAFLDLRQTGPWPVDVTHRVMEKVAALPTPQENPSASPAAARGWLIAGAASLLAGLSALAWITRLALTQLSESSALGAVIRSGSSTAGAIGARVWTVLSTLVNALVASVASCNETLSLHQTQLQTLSIVTIALAVAASLMILARDFGVLSRVPAHPKER